MDLDPFVRGAEVHKESEEARIGRPPHGLCPVRNSETLLHNADHAAGLGAVPDSPRLARTARTLRVRPLSGQVRHRCDGQGQGKWVQ